MSKGEVYPECFLGSTVTPSEYWLVSRSKAHVQEVKALEETLSEEMNKILELPDNRSLELHYCIALESQPSRGAWQRGKIINKVANDKYKVFMIDSGCFIDASRKQIQILTDTKYTEVEPLSFKLCLYGLVPCINVKGSRKVSEMWTESAINFVDNLFNDRLFFYVKKDFIINRTVYGDLYFVNKPGGQLKSLGKMLCQYNYAVYSPSYYKQKNLNSAESKESFVEEELGSSPDLNMKLQRVREWQLTNMDYLGNPSPSEESNTKPPSTPSSGNQNTFPKTEDLQTPKPSKNVLKKPKPYVIPDSQVSGAASGTADSDSSTLPVCTSTPKNTLPSTEEKNNIRRFSPDVERSTFKLDVLETHPQGSTKFDIFTVFRDSVIRPIDKFRFLNISENIIMNLEREGNFTKLSPIQRWAIPSIQRGHNVVVIGGSRTGKTLSYILPMLELLQDKLKNGQVMVGNGPMVIILCSSSRSCDTIYNMFRLLSNVSNLKDSFYPVNIEVVHGCAPEREAWVRLTNGCDVLISTPLCMLRLLKYRSVTNLERLFSIVVDEADIIASDLSFLSAVKSIFHRSQDSGGCQKVFCGEKWSGRLDNMINSHTQNYTLLIASYLEAAVYAKLRPHVFLVDREKKARLVSDITSKKIGKCKALIVCESTSEVKSLKAVFQSHSPLVAHSEMRIQDIKKCHKVWANSDKGALMICTDDVIQHLGIKDVDLLIHYSLPDESKTNFCNRFSTLSNNYRTSAVSSKENRILEVIILVDELNHYQLPHIVDFVTRLGGKITEEVLAVSNEIAEKMEMQKRDVPICTNLLNFGECRKWKNCAGRHALIKEIDSPKSAISGLVKFEVLHVHGASHLSGRLTAMIDNSNRTSKFEDFTVEIAEKLEKHFASEENRKYLASTGIGELCAVHLVEKSDEKYCRAKIIEYKKVNELEKPTEVLVKLIDLGYTTRVSVFKLYELPEELGKYPEQAIDIYLCSLLPYDSDDDWSRHAVSFAKNLFLRQLKNDQFWIGKVMLSLNSSLHLDPVKLCHSLADLKTYATDFCVGKMLLSNNIALNNSDHLRKLNRLCEKAGIELVKTEVKNEISDRAAVEPDWAFFKDDFVRVQFLSAESTSCLFVRLSKFNDLLKLLEKDCKEEGNRIKSLPQNASRTYPSGWGLTVGSYCLALYDTEWNRARIESIEKDQIFVFFIDYGDFHSTEEVLPIPDELLNRLPAQAIECSLYGVKHEPQASDKLIDELYAFSDEGVNDVYVQVHEKSERSSVGKGRKYTVNLISLTGVSLNKRLINMGLAEGEDGQPVDDVEMEESELEADSDSIIEDCVGCFDDTNVTVESSAKVGDASDPSYFLTLAEGAFDNENSQFMLEEFMSQCMPMLRENVKPEKAEARRERSEEVKPPQEEPVKKTSRKYLKEKMRIESAVEAKTSASCYTPQVLWSQNHEQVQMKIVLNNVKTYSFDCSTNHVVFRCFADGKLYAMSIRLFGSVNAELTELQSKTFFVRVVLRKLCPLPWPRLTRDAEKLRYIQFDVDNYTEQKTTFIEQACKKAIEEIESGRIKPKPKIEEEIQCVPSSDSEYSTPSESDSDDLDDL